ncbi:FecR family protein [Chitinophaga rhizophila]|uniref:FecR domain-containing protein n=1 Tax=Chitinophaga rhizophila TaxID=2866212 RepID=A0ABS7GAV1_9BACT|nr:FecR domain-containing protein [Chitinophaga rhizophila]MBW8684789.1 FecR domain-containing protein [Chitinophaga rhizophila]
MKRSVHYYASFTAIQLAADPYFLEWVRFPEGSGHQFWEQFLKAYPEKAADIDRATAIARSMYVIADMPSAQQQEDSWKRILQALPQARPGKAQPTVIRSNARVWMAAAAVVALAVAVWVIFRPINKEVNIVSGYGEVKDLLLPDGTKVKLNGNSGIRYSEHWAADMPREVWLDGEAFFDVKPVTGNDASQPFAVHTGDINVQVLGTSFNVRNRRGTSDVMLTTGKVIVAAAGEKQLLSRPGELAVYNSQKLEKKTVQVSSYISWQEQKLQLDQTRVSDLFARLEDDWGYKIQLTDTSLLHKRISGEIDMKEKQILINALALILRADVSQQGDSTIIITPN